MSSIDVLDKVWEGLKNVIQDVAKLDVVTLTGNITLKNDGTVPINNFEDFIKALRAGAGTDIKALAISHYEPDGDAALFIKEGLSPEQLKLFDLHMQTVKSSQDLRTKAAEILLNFIKPIKL